MKRKPQKPPAPKPAPGEERRSTDELRQMVREDIEEQRRIAEQFRRKMN